jgi:hypothetical protein
VREYRLSLQETVGAAAMGAVEELLGRRVLTRHSQIGFDPPRTFEIFVLEPQSGWFRSPVEGRPMPRPRGSAGRAGDIDRII